MLSIRFIGAAREVTGSMHRLDTPGGSLLVDCGFYQGRREESFRRNRNLPKEATSADAVILTHAHIDHSGSLPTLVRGGWGGAIWATPATRDLCAYMLRDSARIQEADADWLNRKFGDSPDWTPIKPIYGEDDAIRAVARTISVPYGIPFTPIPGVTARFIDAGHILGSAEVVLDVALPGGGTRRVAFSGDLGRKGMPILRDPEYPDRPDYVVMESTYGGRVHGTISEVHDELARVVNETVRRKGKLVIPAFSLGRTQEIIFALNQLHIANRIPGIPVFVDSPLSVSVTEVFKLHPECYDDEVRAFIEKNGDPFSFQSLRYVMSREESMALNTLSEPAIIISASGMCESGRVLHHLRNTVEDERNTILIVGFQAQHTLGRRLVEHRPRVRIFGVERDLHATVVALNGLSAHGDRRDLEEYARRAQGARRIFLVHGEPEQQEPLQASLAKMGFAVDAPAAGDSTELD
jgi:metallo-beta-lactamase family protein